MCVLTITTRHDPLRIVRLKPRSQIVGRSVSADILISDRSVSRTHARIEYDATSQTYSIQDLGSFNGVFFGTARLAAARTLQDRDTFSLGSATIRFRARIKAPSDTVVGDSWITDPDVPTTVPENSRPIRSLGG